MTLVGEGDGERLSPFFRGRMGHWLFRGLLHLTGIDKVNASHDRVERAGVPFGPEFSKALLDDMGLDFQVGNPERLQALSQGPFIVLANHMYGHLDGMALLDLLGHVRPKTKVMVNEILLRIRGLAPSFISVNPSFSKKDTATATSINGIKQALLQLRQGEGVAIFPSGAVADFHPFGRRKLLERDWQDAAIKLIRKVRVPVLPIRFFDHNSWFYYTLGLLGSKVRLVRLCHEMFNKQGQCPRLALGPVISVPEQDAVRDAEFKAFLRRKVEEIPLPETFVKRSALWK